MKYYYGIFIYSPNNTNITKYDLEKDKCFLEFKGREINDIKLDIENIKKRIAIEKCSVTKEHYENKILILERKLENIFVKTENQVFYIATKRFKILFETKNIFYKGHFTKEVLNAMNKFGISTEKYLENIKTSSTMEDLKEHVRIEKRLKKISKNYKK